MKMYVHWYMNDRKHISVSEHMQYAVEACERRLHIVPTHIYCSAKDVDLFDATLYTVTVSSYLTPNNFQIGAA